MLDDNKEMYFYAFEKIQVALKEIDTEFCKIEFIDANHVRINMNYVLFVLLGSSYNFILSHIIQMNPKIDFETCYELTLEIYNKINEKFPKEHLKKIFESQLYEYKITGKEDYNE